MIRKQSVTKSRVDFAFSVSFSDARHANRFLYTSREFLQEVGLYDYRNRVYSAEFGRLLQSDPIRFDAGDYNLYRYVGNKVSRSTDAMGLCEDGPIDPDGDEDGDGKPNWKDDNDGIDFDGDGKDFDRSSTPSNRRDRDERGGGGGGESCMSRCLREQYGESLGWFDDLGYYGIGAAAVGVGTDAAAHGVGKALDNAMRKTLQGGLDQGRNPSAPAQRARDGATRAYDRMSKLRGGLRGASKASGVIGGSATVASLNARAYCQWKCSGGY